jgi:uncharacterized protein (TIGR02145 family)
MRIIRFLSIVAVILVYILVHSCKKKEVPTLTTSDVSNIKASSATCGGAITDEGTGPVVERGVCWNTAQDPTISNSITVDGNGFGDYTSNLTQLLPNTKYYVRAYATNSVGTSYGNQVSFTTTVIVSDYDGNVYNTIIVGTQTWMVENLKTTKYRDGTDISYPGSDNTGWENVTTGAYAWYNNDAATYKSTYGALYNWNAVNTNKLCPTGWHVPTDAEWVTLHTYVGGESVAGGKLKETGTVHWQSPNTGASNEYGFSAVPGGDRVSSGLYFEIGQRGLFWSSTIKAGQGPIIRVIEWNSGESKNIWQCNTMAGISVRCIKDN